MAEMHAWGQTVWGADASTLQLVKVPKPEAAGKDVVVKVLAVSTNPVDNMTRGGYFVPDGKPEDGTPVGKTLIVGWDASGVVEAVGPEVEGVAVGDEVFFAGDCSRDGCFAEYVAVDYRIVAPRPKSVSHTLAASIPLTAITVYEALYDCCGLENGHGKSFLMMAGAGGVGSLGVQFAKKVFGFDTVIATASRPETEEFARRMGADHVINHRGDMKQQLADLGFPGGVDVVLNAVPSDRNFDSLSDLVGVLGHVVLLTPPGKPVNIDGFFIKRAAIHSEMMFQRILFQDEPERQGALLRHFSSLVDLGVIDTRVLPDNQFRLADLPAVLTQQASGTAIGKLVIDTSEGWNA